MNASRKASWPAEATAEANRQRTEWAAVRDVPAARQLIATAGITWQPEGRQLDIARARAAHPEWTWRQIGGSLGLTKDQAVAAFRRLAVKAGLR